MRFLLIFLLIPATLGASQDPLLARLSQPLSQGHWDLSLGLRQFERGIWMDGQGLSAQTNGLPIIVDADGVTKSVKGFRFEFRTLWQAGPHSLIELSLPYYNQEFSLAQINYFSASSLADPSVRRGDGIGDLGLALRQVLFDFGALRLGSNVEFSMPTGLGPFESQHPLVATGSGSFGGALALQAEAQLGDWGAWLQGRMPFDFGANADMANGVFGGFQSGTTTPITLPGGSDFVRRDPGAELDLGLAWTWDRSEAHQHRLLLEFSAKSEGALRIGGGAALPETARQSLDLVPQASFGFSSGLDFCLGWQLPLFATRQAVAYWGEILFRADYRL